MTLQSQDAPGTLEFLRVKQPLARASPQTRSAHGEATASISLRLALVLSRHLAPSKEPLSSRNVLNAFRQTFVLIGFDHIVTAPLPHGSTRAEKRAESRRRPFAARPCFRLC